jgi:cobalt-zinc-cadmium efflux system membrane fusion protein
VRGLIGDPTLELLPGMLANVSVEVAQPESAISIPEDGVVREGDGTMTVWITRDRRHFVQRVVQTGMRDGGRVQILKGVQSGQLVVTDGAIYLDTMIQAPSGDD